LRKVDIAKGVVIPLEYPGQEVVSFRALPDRNDTESCEGIIHGFVETATVLMGHLSGASMSIHRMSENPETAESER